MKITPIPIPLLAKIFTCFILVSPLAAQPKASDYLAARLANSNLYNTSGEQLAWHANSGASRFFDAYLAYEDPSWLEAAQEYWDFIIELSVTNDPDGYPGTIGALIGANLNDPAVVHLYDSLVGDAIVGEHIVRFAEIVMDRPELHDQFLAKAEEYIDLATRMIWEKWNVRETYYEDDRGYGSYHTHPFAVDRSDPTLWIPRPSRKISDNLNKHYRAALVLLRLYRITGNTDYRDRILAIYGRAKAMFRHFPEEDRVVWNFWMPHGPWDMSGSSPSSWVGVHPNRPGYQSGEASDFLEVYNTGLVFTQTDMERIVRTNLWMMDNNFVSADGTSEAGTLWSGLAQLEPRIRDAYENALMQNPQEMSNAISLAYLRNVVDPQAGYDRIFVENPNDVIIDDVIVQPGVALGMAHVIPDRLETINDDEVLIVARTIASGTLTIDLLETDGTVIGNLHTANAGSAYYTYVWDGRNPATGERDWGSYLVRWTLAEESRTWPVFVVEGEEREDEVSGPYIRPGETLSYTFEGPLDEFWELSGAEISNENPMTGSNSLRIGRGQRAEMILSDFANQPVRIEFWQYDTGVTWDSGNANGPAWGIQNTLGDNFSFYMIWRSYLNGNDVVAWINTGENQWFSPRFSGFLRNPGWNHWVYDFSDPSAPVITRNDEIFANDRVTNENPQYLPKGASRLVFIGTRSGLTGDADPLSTLYIDDLKVTHTGDPISVFAESNFTEDFGGGWKWNMMGYFWDTEFPYVYSIGMMDWLYVAGFTEKAYYFWSYKGEFWAFTGHEYYPYYYIMTGDRTGEWVEVER